MYRKLIQAAAFLGALAVIIGAFGAHVIRGSVSENTMHAYETGVMYHFFHVFALINAAKMYGKTNQKIILYACYAFIAGIFLFSGSLYLLTLREAKHIEGLSFLGPITPVGGVAFIAGWLMFATGAGIKSANYRHHSGDRSSSHNQAA